MRAIALDDEPPALDVIERFCRQVDDVELVKTFTSVKEAVSFLQDHEVDLLFLDINMPSVSGIDFYKASVSNIPVIFTTAYSDYAIEGFNVDAIDYLLKPFTPERFMQAIEKAKKLLLARKQNTEDHILLRVDYALVKVMLADIQYIEGLDDYLKIHLANGKPLVVRMTMKKMADQLPASQFTRVHRSYIVPFSRITSVRNKFITVADEEIPIGNSYEEDFMKKWKRP